jgi:hypothetical protein
MAKSEAKKTTGKKSTKKTQDLYYFYSVGCAFCSQAEKVVDELNKEGHNILKLDIADKDNLEIKKTLLKDYKIQCGTPFFVNPETGHNVCGYRTKDIIEKWIAGEEIPDPPKPVGQPPRPPLFGASKKEEDTWTKGYEEWMNNNQHLPDIKTAQEILDMPRPKSTPPGPPQPDASDEDLEKWVKVYESWKNENSHLENLIPSETIVERFKQQRQMMKQSGPPPGQPQGDYRPDEPSSQLNESFYYQVEGGRKVEIHADTKYIQQLKQQYYIRENDGTLSKVVGDPVYAQRVQRLVEKKNQNEAQAKANS